jgi:cytochrome bd-type quinol oxidase subunit 2
MTRGERRIWPWAILAIGAVGLICLFQAWWGLLACDESGGDGLARCWVYDSSDHGGWKAWAVYFIFAPLGLVIVGSLVALIARRRAILRAVAIISLALAVGAFLTGTFLFGSPPPRPPKFTPLPTPYGGQ